ncbi:hypothetical protein BUZ57_10750 [Staphylococcus hyicus]|uniref:Uncharacterized protein n=1 Tax=Staphylococcus hyicus TaxID=1284 RepID=A0A418JGP1_STAHY|nr:hypothetical protein BUZ57_10750 [Staphylococcus hyicus]
MFQNFCLPHLLNEVRKIEHDNKELFEKRALELYDDEIESEEDLNLIIHLNREIFDEEFQCGYLNSI